MFQRAGTMTIDTVRTYWLWFTILAMAGALFFTYPGGYAATAYNVLHGLCAQTPSHTFRIGDRPLPFDARMTGIYAGVVAGALTLGVRDRLLAYGNPPFRVVAGLAAFLAVMALDGMNSLLSDLDLWHPYRPENLLRLVTGYLAGLALAVVLSWLLASSLWRIGRSDAGMASLSHLGIPGAFVVPCAALVTWAPGSLHVLLSAVLALAAWGTLTILMLVLVLLAWRLDDRIATVSQLHVPAAAAALLGLTVMLGLAEFRFWLERTFGISNALM
jgi:uncharacterized membrane protein